MFALFQNLEHSPTLVWCRGTKIKLNWTIRTIKRVTLTLTTYGVCSCRVFKTTRWVKTKSSGAHTVVWKAIIAHLYGEKGNATCDSLMSYSNYSDQLIFYINTQHRRAVVLLNRSDVNKNQRRYSVWQCRYKVSWPKLQKSLFHFLYTHVAFMTLYCRSISLVIKYKSWQK